MASLQKDKKGNWLIQFEDRDGKWRTVRPGTASKRHAKTIMHHIEELNAAKISACSPDRATAAWVATLGDALAGKLSKVGLIEPRGSSTLGPFLDAYIKGRHGLAANTIRNHKGTRRLLVKYFGEGRAMRSVTPGDADMYEEFLKGKKMAAATISREIKRARQFFRVAVRRKLIPENPFTDIATPAQVNPDRQYEVTIEETKLLLKACNSPQQRLIIALARFAGLRIPSELVGLRWSEVNRETERFTVHAPKTERHHTGTRIVPIFEDLAPYLQKAWDAAPEGEDRIFPNITPKTNLRTWLGKLAARAGVALWEKPWVNMRSTRATELADELPSHVAAAWLGHCEAIADQHYRQVTEEHYAMATGKKRAEHALSASAVKPIHNTSAGEVDSKCSPKENSRKSATDGSLRLLTSHDGRKSFGSKDLGIPPRGVEPLSSD